MNETTDEILALSRFLGSPAQDMAILAEGNVSGRCDDDSFWIKASGFHMGSLTAEQLVRVRFAEFEPLPTELSDLEVKHLLGQSRVEPGPLMPSVEIFMHALLLRLPEVNFVGHTHPTPLVSLLGLEIAEELSAKRLFPDEVVCCGPATAFVGYEDPGLPLALAIRESVIRYMRDWEAVPRTIWLANHGLIATGKTPKEVRTASEMAVKAARAWIGAMSTGMKLRPLSEDVIRRINSRPDEHYRQKILAYS